MQALDDKGVQAVEALIIADQPWLGWPFIAQLWQIPFGWLASYFTDAAKIGVTFGVIDLQVGQEETQLSKALQALITAEKSGDPIAIQKAIKDYADAQSALIHDDGSAPVH